MSNSPSVNSARTWIFQANPKYYDIDGALANLVKCRGRSINTNSQSMPGTLYSFGRAAKEVIVAAATVLTAPAVMEQDGLQFAVQADKFNKPSLRVLLRIEDYTQGRSPATF